MSELMRLVVSWIYGLILLGSLSQDWIVSSGAAYFQPSSLVSTPHTAHLTTRLRLPETEGVGFVEYCTHNVIAVDSAMAAVQNAVLGFLFHKAALDGAGVDVGRCLLECRHPPKADFSSQTPPATFGV